jgi:DNA-directed RNA polymerase subunit E'/Rpb7
MYRKDMQLTTAHNWCVTNNCWEHVCMQIEIKAGCGVRLRIIGITVETELKAVGSMKDDYLGVVSGPV